MYLFHRISELCCFMFNRNQLCVSFERAGARAATRARLPGGLWFACPCKIFVFGSFTLLRLYPSCPCVVLLKQTLTSSEYGTRVCQLACPFACPTSPHLYPQIPNFGQVQYNIIVQ